MEAMFVEYENPVCGDLVCILAEINLTGGAIEMDRNHGTIVPRNFMYKDVHGFLDAQRQELR